jgi:hypothetical protein
MTAQIVDHGLLCLAAAAFAIAASILVNRWRR